MEIIKPGTKIDFMRIKWWAMGISFALIAVGMLSMVLRGGPRWGIDFAGGLLVEVRLEKPTTSGEIEQAVKEKGLPAPQVQNAWALGKGTGQEFILRMDLGKEAPEVLAKEVRQTLEARFGAEGIQLRRVELVGPRVGEELRSKGSKAVIFALIGILIYIAWRFEFIFGCGAIFATLHDVFITVGAFCITNREINLPIVAAFLTIVGYSVNDTIVVYDRIRENQRKYRREPLPQTINRSINETLSRTILTAGTVFLTDLALFLFGGEGIHDFAFTLLVGIVVGTYSSIYIASPFVVIWQEHFGSRKVKAERKLA